ncbi:MAG: hypothetical protein ACFFC7_20470 [Candidatus Hermodarchaeota archaeon]
MSESQGITVQELKKEIESLRKRIEEVKTLLREEEDNAAQQSQREDRIAQILDKKFRRTDNILKSLQEKRQLQVKELEELKKQLNQQFSRAEYEELENEVKKKQQMLSALQISLETIHSNNLALKTQIAKSKIMLSEVLAQKEEEKSKSSQQSSGVIRNIINDLTSKKIQLETILREKKKQEEQTLKELKEIELRLAEATEHYMKLQSIINKEWQEG